MRKLQRDRDEARKRRQAPGVFGSSTLAICLLHTQEQEEWEKEIRRQFAEEVSLLPCFSLRFVSKSAGGTSESGSVKAAGG